MTERVIEHRKNRQFLDNLAPAKFSLDELIREKLECGRFIVTKTGWIKIVSLLVSITGIALFVGQEQCQVAPDWYQFLYTICVGASVFIEFTFFLIFFLGGTKEQPGKWVTADIILNLFFAIIAIVGSILTITVKCNENKSLHSIPGPIGIAGGILSMIGCGAIFLMYRYVDNTFEDEIPDPPMRRASDFRKSLHV